MNKLLLATAILALSAAPSRADTFVNLDGILWNTTNAGNVQLQNVVPGGNQPLNAPCLICGATQPLQPAGFGYNDYSNAGNFFAISAYSDQGNGGRNTLANGAIGDGYQFGDGSLFKAFLLANNTPGNLAFSIGVDVNDNNSPQTLSSFYFLNLTTHTVLASYFGTVSNVPSIHNGTGFPDYTLTGFTLDRSDIHLGDTVVFLARMSGLNDGPDSFFLEPAAAAVPGPIVGAGLPGLIAACFSMAGLAWRRRRRNLA